MMLKEQKKENEDVEPALSEPHFEEEWTVLAARQVVPIAELEAKEKRFQSLRLFGAFLVAGSLGVVVALASIRFRESSARVSENEVMPETVAAQTDPNGSSSADGDTEQTNEESSIQVEDGTATETSTAATTKAARTSRNKHRTVNVDFEDQASEDEPTSGSRPQPRLIEQWQEGRPRRVKPRTSGNDRGAHHPRDLRDLDEIFEGSQKKP